MASQHQILAMKGLYQDSERNQNASVTVSPPQDPI